MNGISLHEDVQTRIDNYCLICPSAHRYIEDGFYLSDRLSGGLDKLAILGTIISLTVSELNELGVELTVDFDELLSDGYRVDVIYHLRHNFDRENFTHLLSKLSDSTISILLNCIESDNLDRGYQLIQHLSNCLPYNDTWKFLIENTHLYQTNSLFDNHILALINQKGDNALSDRLVPTINDYQEDLLQERNMIHSTLLKLLPKLPTIPGSTLLFKVKHFNQDLLQPDTLQQLNACSGEIIDLIMNHHKKESDHHFEYYLEYNVQPSKSQMVFLVASMYQPGMTGTELYELFDRMVGKLFEDMSYIHQVIDLLNI